ncbi:MAG: roadblock/LC7 domain-containing protein [Ghiorsea sp.]|nr:roadblock/LC7 domain-containing protein [Ghiorsea sp.]
MTTSELLTETQQKACQNILNTLITNSDIIDTSLLSSPDGILVACAGIDTELDVMAAMSASLISLADAISSRTADGKCHKAFCESDDSLAVIIHAGEHILTVIGKPESNMGMILAQAKTTVASILSISDQ